MNSTISNYIQTQISYPLLIDEMPSENIGMICIVTCHDNDAIARSIKSLQTMAQPAFDIELYVMIYACRDDQQEVHDRNIAIDIALHEIDPLPEWCRLYVITNNNFARPKATAEFAAKIGMDDAVRRFQYMKKPDGLIASLKPDFVVDDFGFDILNEEDCQTVLEYCKCNTAPNV